MIPKRLAGLLALFGTLIAILITLPFTAAFFRAYEPDKFPEWLHSFVQAFPYLFDFTSRTQVYQFYGRIYSFVVPLTLPSLLVLKKQVGTETLLSLWGWRVFWSGVLLGGAGILEYWPDPNSNWVYIGFFLDLAGTLVLWVGAILYGIAALRSGQVPRWVGYGLIGIVPGDFIGFAILSHIPSGSWFGYVIFCLAIGIRSLRNTQHE